MPVLRTNLIRKKHHFLRTAAGRIDINDNFQSENVQIVQAKVGNFDIFLLIVAQNNPGLLEILIRLPARLIVLLLTDNLVISL
jgi:hypothetical protein